MEIDLSDLHAVDDEIYAIDFNAGNEHWYPVTEYNQIFLRGHALKFNEILRDRGHVFLNDIYDALGVKRTSLGAVVGWLYDFERPTEIVFKISETGTESGPAYHVVFNVDGVMYDQI